MAAALSTESSKVYVGMLIVTCLAMLVGITVMVLEGGKYDWLQKPPASPALQLPPPPKPDTNAAIDSPVRFAEAAKPIAAPPAVPAPLPIVKQQPVAPVVEAAKPIETKPADTTPLAVPPPSGPIPSPLAPPPSGPIPSPLVIPGGR